MTSCSTTRGRRYEAQSPAPFDFSADITSGLAGLEAGVTAMVAVGVLLAIGIGAIFTGAKFGIKASKMPRKGG